MYKGQNPDISRLTASFMMKTISDIISLPEEDRNHVFKVIDALISDYKASKR
jgi:hypothetical protein